jgi:release factor glutamine methyltransferase
MGEQPEVNDVSSALERTVERLRARSDTPELDAAVLLARCTGKSRSWLAAHPEATVGVEALDRLENGTQRLEQGEPLPYVLGEWEFFGTTFEVNKDVLIPRPETELLVERALDWLREHPGKRRAMDIGTGSGCIAISLAVNAPDLWITATDISPRAIEVARWNAGNMHVEDRITFLEADLIPDLPDALPVDLIVANLPYIPTRTLHGLPVYQQEPTEALDGGRDGLLFIRGLIGRIPRALAPDGIALLEFEASQGKAILELAKAACAQAAIRIHKDLAGEDRLLEIQFKRAKEPAA